MNSTIAPRSLHDHAKALAAKGFAIIPVHDTTRGHCSCTKRNDCGTPGKHPRIRAWADNGSSDPDQLWDWWGKWPNANIGIVTGEPSGIVVLDFDPRHGGKETLENLYRQCPEIKDTLRVKTGGGGWHLYFQLPESGAVSRAGVLPGMDVRGNGGMVVAAGSRHASGGVYLVQNSAPVLPLPAMFLPLVSQRTQERHKSNARATQRDTQEQSKQCTAGGQCFSKTPLNLDTLSETQKQQIRRAIERSIPDRAGVRNDHVFQFGRRLMAVDGIDSETSAESLRPLVTHFHGVMMAAAAKHGFTVKGSFIETMDDFRYAWNRIHTPQEDAMAEAIERCSEALRNATLPEQVQQCLETLGYDDDPATAALVLLCWYLNQHWQPLPFFLGCRAGETALLKMGFEPDSISHQMVASRLIHLVRDGVLKCVAKVKSGQRGTASEYAWTWTPPDTPAPKLDWLQS